MNQQSLLTQLDRLISMHSILQHPFYQAWSAGQLCQEDLSVYSWVYYPHVAAFPNYLEIALTQTQDSEIQKILQDNLQDELANPQTSPRVVASVRRGPWCGPPGSDRCRAHPRSSRSHRHLPTPLWTGHSLCAHRLVHLRKPTTRGFLLQNPRTSRVLSHPRPPNSRLL